MERNKDRDHSSDTNGGRISQVGDQYDQGTDENAKSFIENGFYGIGVGSNLYNKKLIQNKDFKGLTSLSQAYADSIKGRKA